MDTTTIITAAVLTVTVTVVVVVTAAAGGTGVRPPRLPSPVGIAPPPPPPLAVHGLSPDQTRWITWALRYGPPRARLAAGLARHTTRIAHHIATGIIHRLGGHTVCQDCLQARAAFTTPDEQLTQRCPSCLLHWQSNV